MSLLTNVYHLRRVADTSSKACLICYKPSTSVLITPDNKVREYVMDWPDCLHRMRFLALQKQYLCAFDD
jgi:hypothetical protein